MAERRRAKDRASRARKHYARSLGASTKINETIGQSQAAEICRIASTAPPSLPSLPHFAAHPRTDRTPSGQKADYTCYSKTFQATNTSQLASRVVGL